MIEEILNYKSKYIHRTTPYVISIRRDIKSTIACIRNFKTKNPIKKPTIQNAKLEVKKLKLLSTSKELKILCPSSINEEREDEIKFVTDVDIYRRAIKI